MKKVMFSFLVLMAFSVSGFSDDFEDGLEAYDNNAYQSAAKLWTKACDGGNALGCTNLGVMYKNGQGVKQDYRKAKELFGKACDGGEQLGCENYAILNQQGY